MLDLRGMNRILAFDPETGIASVEPGVTIRDLWRHAIPHGYWPKVVPGTMAVSVGGAAAMNIHGKNNYVAGSFGESVRRFLLMTPAGEVLECSRDVNPDVFHAAISGFGMLGCFVELEIELKRVHSGRMKVSAIVAKNLEHNLRRFEELREDSDYLVSWVDLHSRGSSLGRGVLHRANQFAAGEDPEGERFLDPHLQDVPSRLLGVVPKAWLWPWMWSAMKLRMVPMINAMKMAVAPLEARRSPYPQTHGAFHFLLDYVPRWQWMTRPGGLIQFQPFVPVQHSERVLRTIVEECHRARIVPYLGVLKRHRTDPFLMTHAVEGYSLAMDFAVSPDPHRRRELWALCSRLAEQVLDVGGRFYYAKDATLTPSSFVRIHGDEAVAKFRALRQRLDPGGVLQTDLARRLGV